MQRPTKIHRGIDSADCSFPFTLLLAIPCMRRILLDHIVLIGPNRPLTHVSEIVMQLPPKLATCVVLIGCSIWPSVAATQPANTAKNDFRIEAKRLLDQANVSGGFVVHLGFRDHQLADAIGTLPRLQVHGLSRDAATVEKARRQVGRIDGRVAFEILKGTTLPYIDNLVNLIVVDEIQDVPQGELLRVLVPNGCALIKTDGGGWKRVVKPRPGNIDEWTHFMHDSSGNAVAHDDVVGPPRHLQWLGSPRWSRHHDRMASMSAMVSAGGRIFYIMDEGSRISIQLPPKWKLVGRDAFNGSILWKQPIPEWHSHLWPLKSGPTQLARRLVASDDTVFATLGITAPVSAIDAADGSVLRVYEGSDGTEEILHVDGRLFVMANTGGSPLRQFKPQLNLGDQRRIAQDFHWNEQPRHVMGYDVETGRQLWSRNTKVAPLTLVALSGKVLFHDGSKLVCVDQITGKDAWSTPPVKRRASVTFNFGPKLVIHKGVVLFAGGDRKMHAYQLEDGKFLWSAPHAQSGYQSPEDLLVSGGLVWSAPTTRTGDTGVFTGRDPRTGVVKREFPPDVTTYWFHHRCYIAKATDKFLIPSRTGIEFVDPLSKHWDINHWVRGGCLYGVMPCNGLIYAPPHNCACYPEAKLYGMNVLAPTSENRLLPEAEPHAARFEFGPAKDEPLAQTPGTDPEWSTYRQNNARSARTESGLPDELTNAWETKLGGRLSAVTIADQKLFVAQIDAHRLHALNASTGAIEWTFIAGGRIDSPPTIDAGRVIFGSADGWMYVLHAADGRLIWRFRAAPTDRRLMAFEQLESVWPVHGSVLVQNDVAWVVSGRSNYLDGGLRLFRINLTDAKVLSETVINELDPESGDNLQSRLQTLQMPAGLPDVLSASGGHVFMRSQQFDKNGKRVGLGPHSGNAAAQGHVQRGETAHLFAPMGFLDDTWFHRSYWVYGRSFAGGHNGYYQAGKFAPSGRTLVFDDHNVYGFRRKPEYLKWTTILEHELYAADKIAPEVAAPKAARRGAGSMVTFQKSPSLNPKGKAVTVEAWVKADRPQGVVIARGGPLDGYALALNTGKPSFLVRANEKLTTVTGPKPITGRWTHLVGVLTETAELRLYVDGDRVGTRKGTGLLSTDPAQSLEIGADDGSAVGNYRSPSVLTGTVDEVRIYDGALTDDEVGARFLATETPLKTKVKLALSCSFDKGRAQDASGNKNHGKPIGVQSVAGRVGAGLKFARRGGGNRAVAASFVKPHWTTDVPLLVRAMVMSKDELVLVGPPDLIDEVASFKKLTEADPSIQPLLKAQDEALAGSQGGLMLVVSTKDGTTRIKQKVQRLPVWDGLAAAYDRLYMSTTEGSIVCFGKRRAD